MKNFSNGNTETPWVSENSLNVVTVLQKLDISLARMTARPKLKALVLLSEAITQKHKAIAKQFKPNLHMSCTRFE